MTWQSWYDNLSPYDNEPQLTEDEMEDLFERRMDQANDYLDELEDRDNCE